MRESTSAWLDPMIEAWPGSPEELRRLIQQATMPAAEVFAADHPLRRALEGALPPGSAHGAIDWIRFGQLLRQELGWTDYPEYPEGS